MYHIQILRLVCLQPPKSRVSVHLIVQYIVHSYKICSKCVHIDKHNISYKPFFGVKKYKTLSSFLPCQTYTHAVRFGAPQGRSPVAVSSATLYAWLWNRGMKECEMKIWTFANTLKLQRSIAIHGKSLTPTTI